MANSKKPPPTTSRSSNPPIGALRFFTTSATPTSGLVNSGEPFLNDERALALEPNYSQAKANLRIVRDEARALELAPAWPIWISGNATVMQLTVAAAVLFWAGLFLLVSFLLEMLPRDFLGFLSSCLLAAAALVAALFATERGPRGKGLAIVTAPWNKRASRHRRYCVDRAGLARGK